MENKENTVAYWVQKAHDAIHEAENIADETGVGFTFSVEYGMGGYYNPKKKAPKVMTRQEAIEILASGKSLSSAEKEEIAAAIEKNFEPSDDDWDDSEESGWVSSSANC